MNSKLKERIELLARTQIFSGLSSSRLKRLARLCVPQSFQRGDLILEQGGTGLGMFVITEGVVEIFRGEGAGQVTLARLKEGDLLGEVALVDELPRSASARAKERTECLLLSREAFRGLTRKDPEIAWCIVPTLTARLRSAQSAAVAMDSRIGETLDFALPIAAKPIDAENRSEQAPTEARVGALERGFVGALRRQVELGQLGARGVATMATWSDELLESLVEETELDKAIGLDDLRRRVPRGLSRVGRSAVVEAFKMPRRVLDLILEATDSSASTPVSENER